MSCWSSKLSFEEHLKVGLEAPAKPAVKPTCLGFITWNLESLRSCVFGFGCLFFCCVFCCLLCVVVLFFLFVWLLACLVIVLFSLLVANGQLGGCCCCLVGGVVGLIHTTTLTLDFISCLWWMHPVHPTLRIYSEAMWSSCQVFAFFLVYGLSVVVRRPLQQRYLDGNR